MKDSGNSKIWREKERYGGKQPKDPNSKLLLSHNPPMTMMCYRIASHQLQHDHGDAAARWTVVGLASN